MRGPVRPDVREAERTTDACRRHFAFVVGQDDCPGQNSTNEDEPNVEPHKSREPSDAAVREELSVSEFEALNAGHHQMGEGPRGIDESRVCLLDTACTSCMHSREWRVNYARHLPEGIQCEETDQWKVFHFANGSSTSERAQVWKIPVVIAGHRGVVLSAEIPTGSTPLLLSITAMSALDMSLHMQRRTVAIGALKSEVPMLLTRTRHLALDLTGSVTVAPQPNAVCNAEDVFMYFVEEAAFGLCTGEPEMFLPPLETAYSASVSKVPIKLGPRGVQTQDKLGSLSQRRVGELEKVQRQLRGLDNRTWVALKRNYTFAEELATKQFTTTVFFEPWGGCFGCTRFASQFMGWTNSQPLDLIDGFDLMAPKGQRLLWKTLVQHNPYLTIVAFDCRIWSLLQNCNPKGIEDIRFLRRTVGAAVLRLIVRVCLHRDRRGRFYLIENPAGSAAWAFEWILSELLERGNGKFIICDQCAYGKIDSESRRPIKKATGFLSNNELLLNHLGKRCKCKFGAHQHVVGSNRFGKRSQQAAAYPAELCRAICLGTLESMKIDYAVNAPKELAYPVSDEMEVEEELPDLEVLEDGESELDTWESQDDKIIRRHVHPRKA